MHIILAAVEPELADAWEQFCGDLPGVSVHRGSILDVECDAVVSPANSFGFMDGGIDRLYSHHFGWQVERRLQQHIRQHHRRELLVGTAAIVETDHARIPWLISAPTMRVPMILRDTINPYLACRAALWLVTSGQFVEGMLQGHVISEGVQRIAFSGLGTGVGRVPFETCARQVRAAIEETLLQPPEFPSSWFEAQARHQQLYTDDLRDLQRG
jgi:O-acetyl-ADP-ribose deacetylase (regulator of RNase III)